MIGDNALAELERLCSDKISAAEEFNAAVRHQAEAYGLDPQALGRYVTARVRDRLEKLAAERDTLEQLQASFPFGPPQ